MTERHPGLVLHMLDILDDNSKHALKHSTDYVGTSTGLVPGLNLCTQASIFAELLEVGHCGKSMICILLLWYWS